MIPGTSRLHLNFLLKNANKNLGLAKFTLWSRKVEKLPVLFKQLYNVGLTQIVFLGKKGIFGNFFYSINLGLKKFSLLPWQFHRHIDLVVDFINLGLAKQLRPQDAVRALHVGLV